MSLAAFSNVCAQVAEGHTPTTAAMTTTRTPVLKLQPHVISQCHRPGGGDEGMLETIAIILIILWLLGMVSGYTLGNFIWVLLVIAVVLFLVRLVSGRRVV
jgi:hypothetical protein